MLRAEYLFSPFLAALGKAVLKVVNRLRIVCLHPLLQELRRIVGNMNSFASTYSYLFLPIVLLDVPLNAHPLQFDLPFQVGNNRGRTAVKAQV